MKNQNKKYDAWLNWNVTLKCNLSCDYCCQHTPTDEIHPIYNKLLELMIPRYRLKRTIFREAGKKIDISSLIRTLDKTNKIFKIGFSGGEPFLISNFIEACEKLTKRHYISLVTNLTSDKIKEFCEKIDPLRVVHLLASTHIKELERFNLLSRYISNFLMCKKRGYNISAYEVAYPPLLTEAEKYRKFFKEKGIELNFDPFLGNYSGKRYPQAYTEQEIEVFGLNMKSGSYAGTPHQKGKLCNAGYNVGMVGLYGEIRPCISVFDIIGNIYGEIKFKDKLIICPHEFCPCPFNDYDRYLFGKALEEQGANERQYVDYRETTT